MSQITKRALEASLKNLLAKRPLDKITVTDITEDCGINRMTFYYHFKDIYDLVEWACLEDATRALAGKKTAETWQQGFLQIFEEVRKNKVFIMNVYRCVSREQVERYLTPLTDDLLMGVVNEFAAGMTVREEDKAFIARVYAYAFVGVMLDWIREGMKAEPEPIVERLALVLQGISPRRLRASAWTKLYQKRLSDKIFYSFRPRDGIFIAGAKLFIVKPAFCGYTVVTKQKTTHGGNRYVLFRRHL